MKNLLTLLFLTCATYSLQAQDYANLEKLENIPLKAYYSKNAKKSALSIATRVAKADAYYTEKLKTTATYTLLILNPEDWKTHTHAHAIYGIPHYLPDGKLVVAAENNDFWKRNGPPINKIAPELAKKMKDVYEDESGEINLQKFFDLLAIHELDHAFQKSVQMNAQTNWLNELMCNIWLHTFIAEKESETLAALSTLPSVSIQAIDKGRLKYTSLEDFEQHYGEIAQNYPDNYGWFQYRLHTAAATIYNQGGEQSMLNIWNAFLRQKEKLPADSLQRFLQKTDKHLGEIVANWNKN